MKFKNKIIKKSQMLEILGGIIANLGNLIFTGILIGLL